MSILYIFHFNVQTLSLCNQRPSMNNKILIIYSEKTSEFSDSLFISYESNIFQWKTDTMILYISICNIKLKTFQLLKTKHFYCKVQRPKVSDYYFIRYLCTCKNRLRDEKGNSNQFCLITRWPTYLPSHLDDSWQYLINRYTACQQVRAYGIECRLSAPSLWCSLILFPLDANFQLVGRYYGDDIEEYRRLGIWLID